MAAGLLLGPWIFNADGNGAPFAGGLLTTYVNGTTTNQATYTTAALTVPLPNPIVADANGRFPDIWGSTGNTYSIKWTQPTGTLIATYDGRIPLGASDSSTFALSTLINVGQSDGLAAGIAWGLTGQGFRNRVINGEMTVNRRNGDAAVALASGARTYAFDRFSGRRVAAGGAATLSRATGGPSAFPYNALYLQTTGAVAAASDQAYIETVIEGFHIADALLGASGALTLAWRFWVQSSVAGKYSAYLQNSDRSRSYVVNFTTSAGNTWQEFAFQIGGDQTGTWLSDANAGVIMGWDCGSGSSYEGAPLAWAASDRRRTSDSIKISGSSSRQLAVAGVQLAVVGSASLNPSFERRAYVIEGLMCQRYYVPLAGSQASGGSGPAGFRSGTAAIFASVSFGVAMRVAPSLANPGPAAWVSAGDPLATSNISFFDAATGGNLTIAGALTLGVSRASTTGALLLVTAGTSFNGSAGDSGFFQLGSAAYLGFDADFT